MLAFIRTAHLVVFEQNTDRASDQLLSEAFKAIGITDSST